MQAKVKGEVDKNIFKTKFDSTGETLVFSLLQNVF